MQVEEFATIYVADEGLFTPTEFRDIMFTLTVKGYESKTFNRPPRRFVWNEDKILKYCRSYNLNSIQTDLRDAEVISITSKHTVLLGEIHTASTYKRKNKSCSLIGSEVTVTIEEFECNTFHSNTSKEVYRDVSRTWDGDRLKVVLPQPILIKPKHLYEIRLILPNTDNAYYYGSWKPTAEPEKGGSILFHQNPTLGHDNLRNGWIRRLDVNVI